MMRVATIIFQRFRKEFGDARVVAYAGAEAGVQYMKASEWVSSFYFQLPTR